MDHPLDNIRRLLEDLNHRVQHIANTQEKIMATQAELAAQVATITAQLTKIGGETSTLLQKIADLTAIIDAGGTVTPELQAAVDALKAQAQVVDDLVPG